jgi:hypothetical protein
MFFIMLLACFWSAHAARADEGDPVQTGRYGAWRTFRFVEGGKPVCFMSSRPRTEKGNYSKRGEVLFFVTHWSDTDKNVVSVSAGYVYKPKSRASVEIGGKVFGLFTKEDMAWTRNGVEDEKLVRALKSGNVMVVKGFSGRGTATTDTYTLDGSTAALKAIETCN